MTVKLRKIAAPFLMTLLCGALLHGQSLYELAQKEKARRAKLKGKTSRVITNADLRMSEKTASNTTTSTQPAPTKNPQKASPPSESSNPRAVQARSDREEEQRETAAAGQRAGQRNLAATNPPQKRRDTSGSRNYATEVLSNTILVDNPDFALKSPDGKFAEIKISGVLILSLVAQNGPGPDFAVYARPPAVKASKMGSTNEEGMPVAAGFTGNVGFWYGVFAMDKNGEWIEIGGGSGSNGPNNFDLGNLTSTTMIRIIFNPYEHVDISYNRHRVTSQEITYGIDAVAILH